MITPSTIYTTQLRKILLDIGAKPASSSIPASQTSRFTFLTNGQGRAVEISIDCAPNPGPSANVPGFITHVRFREGEASFTLTFPNGRMAPPAEPLPEPTSQLGRVLAAFLGKLSPSEAA